MKKISTLLVLAIFTIGTTWAQTYSANTKESKLKWTGEKVTGEHVGDVLLKSGTFVIEESKITSATFEIDMSSITCTDLTDAGYNAKLVGHLKSDDFFGVATYPTAKFVLSKAAKIKGGKAVIKGKLTIKKATKPIEFRAIVKQEGESISIFGNIVVDRSKFDIRYGSGSFFDNLGDKTIYDEFKIRLNVIAAKSASR